MVRKDVLERSFSTEKRYCTNEDYIPREIAGETILVPTGASADHFNGMLTLNETSRFRKPWRQHRNGMMTIPNHWNRIFMIL